MAADSAGNDLSAAKVVVTSAYRFAPYDASKTLNAALIAPTVADVKTSLDTIFSKGVSSALSLRMARLRTVVMPMMRSSSISPATALMARLR